jgi:hypothetical protein
MLSHTQVIEVTPSEGLVVFTDRSQHGSMIIRASGEREHLKGRSSGPGDPSGSVLLAEGDQIQLGGVTLILEKLTPDHLRDDDIEEEAAAVVHGFDDARPQQAVTTTLTGAGQTASAAAASAVSRDATTV